MYSSVRPIFHDPLTSCYRANWWGGWIPGQQVLCTLTCRCKWNFVPSVRELRSWGMVIGWAPEHQGSGSLRKCLESGCILSQTIQERPLLWSALDLLSCALRSRGCPVGCGPRQGWHGGTLALRRTASVSSRSAGSYLPGLKGSMIRGFVVSKKLPPL